MKPKLCECGCERITTLHRGKYKRFIYGHNMKGNIPWNKNLNKEIDERVRKQSEIMKGRKHTDEHKEKISKGTIKAMQNPKIREKISNGVIKALAKPEIKKKHREGVRNAWKKFETRKNFIATITEAMQRADVKKNLKEGIKIRNSNPDYQKKIHIINKKTMQNPKVREKISIGVKKAFKNNPELIQKIKDARAKQIFPIKDSSIEVKIQNYLKELKINFFTHHHMKINHGYQCDILIPHLSLVIECDGDYWHNYPIGNPLDHIRTKELTIEGFKVLRLWEHEIRSMSIGEFKSRLGGD